MPDLKKLAIEQKKLALKVSLSDEFGKISYIGGCDLINIEDRLICSLIILDYKTKEVIEKKYSVKDPEFQHISGFLSYREAPAIIETFQKLDTKPNLLFIDGNGILHPRKLGIASHVGLLLDIPTIGIAKKKPCGQIVQDSIYIDKDCVGKEIHLKEVANPFYMSPGHKISMRSAHELTKELSSPRNKLPLPIHKAHSYGVKIKNSLKKKED